MDMGKFNESNYYVDIRYAQRLGTGISFAAAF